MIPLGKTEKRVYKILLYYYLQLHMKLGLKIMFNFKVSIYSVSSYVQYNSMAITYYYNKDKIN